MYVRFIYLWRDIFSSCMYGHSHIKFNMHPFLVLTVIAVLVGLVCGIPTEEVISTVKSGFGNILASIGIVILAGTIIGTILEKTGAALTMANTILRLSDKKRAF